MTVLAIVCRPEEAPAVVAWASHFARAGQAPLSVACWAYSPSATAPPKEEVAAELSRLAKAVQQAANESIAESPGSTLEIHKLHGPKLVTAALQRIRADRAELVVAASMNTNSRAPRDAAPNALLRHSPCNSPRSRFGLPEF